MRISYAAGGEADAGGASQARSAVCLWPTQQGRCSGLDFCICVFRCDMPMEMRYRTVFTIQFDAITHLCIHHFYACASTFKRLPKVSPASSAELSSLSSSLQESNSAQHSRTQHRPATSHQPGRVVTRGAGLRSRLGGSSRSFGGVAVTVTALVIVVAGGHVCERDGVAGQEFRADAGLVGAGFGGGRVGGCERDVCALWEELVV